MNKVQKEAIGSIETEQVILGAMLIEKSSQNVAFGLVKNSEIFSIERHRIIFESCRELFNDNLPVDLITVVNKISTLGKSESVGGPSYLAELTSKVSSGANLEFHIRIIHEAFVRRAIIDSARKNIVLASDETKDVFELIDRWQRQILAVSNELSVKKGQSIKNIAKESLAEIALAMENNGVSGIPTGLNSLNSKLGGFQKEDLIILAGRPGMGKTAEAIQFSLNVALQGLSVYYVNLEMKNTRLINRMVSSITDIPYSRIDKGKISKEEYQKINNSIQQLIELNFEIDNSPAITISELRAKCVLKKAKDGLGLIVVDYLQLMKGVAGNKNNSNREQEVASISRGLKALARELEVPVIALAQLSRAVESRGGDKRPQLSDLRESGAIEQDADVVIFVWRPSYYKIEFIDGPDGTEISTENVIVNLIEKNRGGSIGAIVDFCDIATNKIRDFGYENEKFNNSFSEQNPHSFFAGRNDNFFETQTDDQPF